MTAASYSIMAIPASAQPGWRIRWAERENDRRRRAYDARFAAWQRHHDHLVRLRIEAAGFLGCTQPRAGLPVALDDDEVVYRVLPVADLVEVDARHGTGLPAPGLTVATDDVAGRALPRGVRALDTGMAVVTSRRVAFSSPRGRRHEWRYADLAGPAHHPALPLTLLHATDGRRLAGLRVPAAGTVNFRFYLTLAFAAATGGRAAVAAQLEAILAAHRRARPVPPPPVHPDQAPSSGLRAGPRAALAAAVVAVTFVTLTAVGTAAPERGGPPYRADEGARGDIPAAAPSTPTGATPTGATAPAVPGEPVARRTGAATSGAAALVPPLPWLACPRGEPDGDAAPGPGDACVHISPAARTWPAAGPRPDPPRGGA
ncbi:hypothetical protein RM555_07810 [Micromonospora sp. DSM 115977]|uniref:Uncharacterized protein n=1 Tax=Micromonospora reichwaldensis TaxID=3075516 RepID=A0ABU2WTH6_9ACTN|nr:hypothetical protein [Micromonospora sp. DSM 115977]MDT0528894.1 hypothetical protein [Micromonospora sp. DSM 115977]